MVVGREGRGRVLVGQACQELLDAALDLGNGQGRVRVVDRDLLGVLVFSRPLLVGISLLGLCHDVPAPGAIGPTQIPASAPGDAVGTTVFVGVSDGRGRVAVGCWLLSGCTG